MIGRRLEEAEMIGRRMEAPTFSGQDQEHPLETQGLSGAPWLKDTQQKRKEKLKVRVNQALSPTEECSRLVEYCRPVGTDAAPLPGCERFEELAERSTDPECDCDVLASDMR